MKIRIVLLGLLFSFQFGYGQSSIDYPVYFEYDQSKLDSIELGRLKIFIKNFETVEVDSIEIKGYCDDIGGKVYNDSLSLNRARYVEEVLKSKIKISRISIRGEGLIEINNEQDIETQRQKNRKGEIRIYYHIKEEKVAPLNTKSGSSLEPNYAKFISNARTGEKINLNIHFEGGMHRLLPRMKLKLDTLANLLLKSSIDISIVGHIYNNGKAEIVDGFDIQTQTNHLSENRARAVYVYLTSKGVDTSRMNYKGAGGEFPLGNGAEADRRVEMVVMGRKKDKTQ